ncbi:MAG: hypothetical protein H0X51_06450 [Parachlamydiaceae bacterium]|nr:hypothetical protein [Parachlamydiaceae bacterium]
MKILNSLIFLLITASLSAAEPLINKETKLTFMLPINWVPPTKCNLVVTIPPGYKPLQMPSTWEEATLIEFVPQNESQDEWTEIISINKLIGKKMSASRLVDEIKSTFLKNHEARILQTKSSHDLSYESAQMSAAYNFEKYHEVLGCRYYSGPYDCVGLQYTIRPKKEETDVEIAQRIERFFDANAIVNCN